MHVQSSVMLLKIIMYSSRAQTFPFFCCFVVVAKYIIVGRLFRNIHPSLQYSSHPRIHTSLYDFFLTCTSSSPWLCLFPLVTVCTAFVFKLLTMIIKHFTGYDFSACNNVRHILYNTDVINPVVKLIVHSPVGKLV